MLIFDTLESDDEDLQKSSAFIHFHPFCSEPEINENTVSIGEWDITFEGQNDIRVLDYKFALGFNKTLPAKMLEISFGAELLTRITHQ